MYIPRTRIPTTDRVQICNNNVSYYPSWPPALAIGTFVLPMGVRQSHSGSGIVRSVDTFFSFQKYQKLQFSFRCRGSHKKVKRKYSRRPDKNCRQFPVVNRRFSVHDEVCTLNRIRKRLILVLLLNSGRRPLKVDCVRLGTALGPYEVINAQRKYGMQTMFTFPKPLRSIDRITGSTV